MNSLEEKINKKCPNCGATIEHRYNHRCPYCHTYFDFNIETTKEINPRDLKNVKLIGIRRDQMSLGVILHFEGTYIPIASPLEYGKNNDVLVFDARELTPQEVRFAIRVNEKEFFDRHNLQAIFDNFLPPSMDKYELYKAIYHYMEIYYR